MKSICGVKKIGRVRNVMLKRRYGNKLSLLKSANRRILKWLGHFKRMSDE